MLLQIHGEFFSGTPRLHLLRQRRHSERWGNLWEPTQRRRLGHRKLLVEEREILGRKVFPDVTKSSKSPLFRGPAIGPPQSSHLLRMTVNSKDWAGTYCWRWTPKQVGDWQHIASSGLPLQALIVRCYWQRFLPNKKWRRMLFSDIIALRKVFYSP